MFGDKVEVLGRTPVGVEDGLATVEIAVSADVPDIQVRIARAPGPLDVYGLRLTRIGEGG